MEEKERVITEKVNFLNKSRRRLEWSCLSIHVIDTMIQFQINNSTHIEMYILHLYIMISVSAASKS